MRTRWSAAWVLAGGLAAAGCAAPTASGSPSAAGGVSGSSPTATATNGVVYVAGSTKKVCQLTGDTDYETGAPTSSQTATRFGLKAADHGYSFTYQGKLWFLFGDSKPTPTFHSQKNENRWPDDTSSIDNDAIADTTSIGADGCPVLDFITQTSPAVGAYANPVVTLDGHPVDLRTNESPNSGIEVGGRMYVIFVTDNPTDTCSPSTCPNGLGYPTRSVMAVLDGSGTVAFQGLYNLSAPSARFGQGAKFINVAIAIGSDGYVYFWGTEGGSQYRHSDPFLARMLPGDIANATSSGQPAAIQYFSGDDASGAPEWSTDSESAAVPLFSDTPPCMGELGVEWDQFIGRWVMLYNCLDSSPANPRGIYVRTAPQPWGPWSAPQTIFNPVRDHGLCYFIHSAGSCPAGAPNPPSGSTSAGGNYGPYFLAGWTTGRAATATSPATSTLYYTLDTFVPYGVLIMSSTIEG